MTNKTNYNVKNTPSELMHVISSNTSIKTDVTGGKMHAQSTQKKHTNKLTQWTESPLNMLPVRFFRLIGWQVKEEAQEETCYSAFWEQQIQLSIWEE